jgi:putative hemolysin
MDTKKIISIIGVCLFAIAVIVLMIRFIYGGPEDMWVCEQSGWVKHGNPRDPKPERVCGVIQKNSAGNTSVANPASVFCLDEGGSIEFRADANGNMYGVCIFDDGRTCEEWDFYRTKVCNDSSDVFEGEMEEMPTY